MSVLRARAGAWLFGILLFPATALTPAPALARWPDQVVVSDGVWEQVRGVQMFADPGGGWVVAWDGYGADSHPVGQLRRLDPNGAAEPGWTPPPVTGNETYARMAAHAPDGSVFTCYRHWDGPSIRLVRHLPDASLAPGYPPTGLQVGTGPIEAQVLKPAIALDDSCGVYVAWLQQVQGPPDVSRIWLTRRRADGSLAPGWPEAGLLVAEFPGWVTGGPALARDGASGVVVVWGETATVRALRIAPDGAIAPGWSAAGLSLTSAGNVAVLTPQLLGSGPGHVLALWREYASGSCRIALQRFSLTGALDGAWPEAGFAIQEDGLDVVGMQMVPDGAEGTIVVWTSSEADARATRVLAGGTLAAGWPTGGRPLLTEGHPIRFPGQADVGFTCAPTPDGGLLFASSEWTGTQYAPRVRWILSDGSIDPGTPAEGTVIPYTRGVGGVLRAVPDGLGGALVAWEQADETGFLSSLVVSRVFHPSVLATPPSSAPARKALAIAPNPAMNAATVEFATESDEPGVLRLFDLGGRVVRESRVPGRGRHVVRLDALDRLPAGLYVVQYRQGAATRTARVTVVH